MLPRKVVVKEYKGFSLGDPVYLTGACVPKTKGHITKIAPDHLAGNEMAFEVAVKNETDGNTLQSWWPIYIDELKKA